MAAISRYTSEADVVRFFERRHDIVLVETVKEILASQGGQKKMFFMLHTLGSHFNLTSRYPREFAVFPDGLQSQFIQRASDSSSHAELLGAYDNTIVYTDYVLSQLIEVLRQRPGIKTMLYVPDHGDNLRDDSRNMFGHGHSNEYDLPIPMLFWFSPEYRQRFPEKIEAVRANAARPVNTRVVFYSLTDMAGAALDDPQLSHFSVFSSGFTNFKRMTFGRPAIFDFDEWMSRTGTTIPVVTPPN
jgi:glucan phosphoethanolaminetransferase (alkaline phosphatase superfamily)